IIGEITVMDDETSDELKINVVNNTIPDSLGVINNTCINMLGNTFCRALLVAKQVFTQTNEQKTLDFTIVAIDKAGLTLSKPFALDITKTNKAPTDILLNQKVFDSIKVPDSRRNMSLGVLSTSDPDSEDKHYYSLTNADGIVYIEGNDTLKLNQNAALLLHTNYTISIMVTDNGIPPKSYLKNVTITLEIVNVLPDGLTISNNKIKENSVSGTLIGLLEGHDLNNLREQIQTLTYTIDQNP
ncbi:unnamed protein product, partial [Owenia fusiformis]